MPLYECPLGLEFTVVECAAAPELRRRLGTMGVLPGAKVTPMRATHGNLVLCVCEGRLAIDRELARCIQVV
jgi:Fe2+ transport system protein FeoA